MPRGGPELPPLEPFVAFRDPERNTLAFLPAARQQPSGALTAGTNLLLLVHGYNDPIADAAQSYRAWKQLQVDLGGIPLRNVVAVYWPGSNWERFAVYIQAVSTAKEAARRLATELRHAAAGIGLLRVRIVAHSLGSRLVVEMMEELREQAEPRLVVERLVVMAAAVPTRRLAPGQVLRDGLDGTGVSFLSLFSGDDSVLRFAFPIGESLAGGGFFPVALGRRRWQGGEAIGAPRLTQDEVVGAGHGDYWGGKESTRDRAGRAARVSREFLNLGTAPRVLSSRATPERPTVDSRVTTPARSTPIRR